MQEKFYCNDAESPWLYIPEDELFTQQSTDANGSSEKVGARLIAPTIDKLSDFELSDDAENGTEKDGFQLALDGAYPLEKPYLSLEKRQIYSLDMVRLNFEYGYSERFCEFMDTQMVFATSDSFTSNRIGTYRFMWTFDYADGKDGGYVIVKDGETIADDGTKGVVVKVGYGVIEKGGVANKRGFIEFNPNKCEKNGRRLLDAMFALGCDFELARYDVAIDIPISRRIVRTIRDKRRYEYVSSNTGITEYLGQRSNPGRVKVYDKAGESGLDCDLTRVELTSSAQWDLDTVCDKLPICPKFGTAKAIKSAFKLVDTWMGDVFYNSDEQGNENLEMMFPEKYLGVVDSDLACRWRKKWKCAERLIDYDRDCVALVMARARSFVPIVRSYDDQRRRKLNDEQTKEWYTMMGYDV